MCGISHGGAHDALGKVVRASVCGRVGVGGDCAEGDAEDG